ncbi:MAG: hypothetical protein QOF48_3016 [Verrucomicrobiota bacterium]|jgi:hypothetical protein
MNIKNVLPTLGSLVLCLAAGAAFIAPGLTPSAAAAEQTATVTIKADGSVVLRLDSTETRLRAEQQARSWEKIKKLNEAAEEADEPPKPAATPKETKPYTDDELAKKVRESLQERNEQGAGDSDTKIESVVVGSNSVRITMSQFFSSLDGLLQNPYAISGQSGLSFESIRIETDATNHLRLTLTPPANAARWAKNVRQMWKLSGTVGELRFVFPGKVLSSGFPNTGSNQTWIAFDTKNEKSLDAAAKLFDAPTVIIADGAGLKLDAPIDSMILMRHGGRAGHGDPDLPLTDAGPGFVAEPSHVTVTTFHFFPEGGKHLKETLAAVGYQPTGAVVQAKFFPPKGRTLQSVQNVRVLNATDDKGRHLAVATNVTGMSESPVVTGGRAGQPNSVSIHLNLPLPAPDARSIEQIDAEAIAITVGNWKTMVITNLAGRGTNAVDLGAVLPGATLVFTKVTSKNQQTTIQGQFRGPVAIRQLDIQANTGDRRNSSAWMNERSFKAHGAESTRGFTLQTNAIDDTGEELQGSVSIVVRHPEDRKRERVKFTLKGLDLL